MAGNPIFAILWFFLLLLIAWPVAFVSATIWVICQPFEACCGCAGDCGSVFERYAAWPKDVGDAIANCRSGCPQP